MLKLQFRDRRRESVWLVDENFTIGKASNNSLVIDDPSILDQHVAITNKTDQVKVTNIANSPQVSLNGKPVGHEAPLRANDVLTLGTVELELIDPKAVADQANAGRTTNFTQGWSIYSSASWLEQNRYTLDKKVIIGRDPGCDIVLPLDHLSRKHVSLEIKNGQLHLQDLDSSNGTFVNGKQVSQAQLKPGDKIKLDVVTFEVSGPAKAHDPNKTIIRSVKETPNKGGGQSRLATKIESAEQGVTAKKKVAKKRLASDGKQDWIQDNNEQADEQSQGGNKAVIIAITIVVIGLAIASTAVIL